jgi:hypothetical protein
MWSLGLRVLVAAVVASLAFAAPATADSGEYLHAVQPWYITLSAEQLLSEGNKVCAAMRNGMNAPTAVQMVQNDLGASVPAAGDIVSAAAVHLGC